MIKHLFVFSCLCFVAINTLASEIDSVQNVKFILNKNYVVVNSDTLCETNKYLSKLLKEPNTEIPEIISKFQRIKSSSITMPSILLEIDKSIPYCYVFKIVNYANNAGFLSPKFAILSNGNSDTTLKPNSNKITQTELGDLINLSVILQKGTRGKHILLIRSPIAGDISLTFKEITDISENLLVMFKLFVLQHKNAPDIDDCIIAADPDIDYNLFIHTFEIFQACGFTNISLSMTMK